MKKYQIGSSVAFSIVYAANMTVNVKESRSIVTIDLTGNGTLALDSESTSQVGDELILKVSSDETARNLTLGTGFTAPAISGTISKTKVQSFVYDGAGFVPSGAVIQID